MPTISLLTKGSKMLPPLGWGGFKFENWCRWPNSLEKYSKIIANLVYSNEIQICGEISSKNQKMALAMVSNASNQKTNTTVAIKTYWDRQLWCYGKISFVLVQKHRKVNFVIFHKRFMSANSALGTSIFSLLQIEPTRPAQNLMI